MMNTGPPRPPAPPYSVCDLPARVDVVVIGGGPAACWCALRLAQAGVSVAMLVENVGLMRGHAGHGMANLTLGLTDAVSRLVNGMGKEKTEHVLGIGLESRALVSEFGGFVPTGGYHVAADERERIEIFESTVHLRKHGGWRVTPCETEFGPAFHSPLEGRVEVGLLAKELTRLLAEKEVCMLQGTIRSQAILASGQHVITTDLGGLRTDLIVHADGWRAGGRDPFLASVLTPVREQLVAFPDVRKAASIYRFQYGYQYWGWSDSHLLYGGCRWGSMHFEVGESEATCNPAIHAHLCRIAGERYPVLGGPSHAWATIMTHSCDGLPLVGALPGRPSELVCGGLQGHDWSLGPALGQSLARMIIDGDETGVPGWLRPRRLA